MDEVAASAPLFSHSRGVERNEKVPFFFTFVDGCTEQMDVEGTAHFLMNVTQDHRKRGSGYHFKGHVNFQGVSAIGLTSGRVYRFIATSNEHLNEDFDSAPFNFTTTAVLKAIAPGESEPNDDLHAHLVTHTTVNANGEITSTHERIRIECK